MLEPSLSRRLLDQINSDLAGLDCLGQGEGLIHLDIDGKKVLVASWQDDTDPLFAFDEFYLIGDDGDDEVEFSCQGALDRLIDRIKVEVEQVDDAGNSKGWMALEGPDYFDVIARLKVGSRP